MGQIWPPSDLLFLEWSYCTILTADRLTPHQLKRNQYFWNRRDFKYFSLKNELSLIVAIKWFVKYKIVLFTIYDIRMWCWNTIYTSARNLFIVDNLQHNDYNSLVYQRCPPPKLKILIVLFLFCVHQFCCYVFYYKMFFR